jgi:hypothetical protein
MVESKWPSLDLIYDEIKGRLAYQQTQIGALDAKANFGLGSASLLTAGITALQTASRPSLLGDVLTAGALAVYVLVIVFSFCAYRLRSWSVTPNPRQVLEDAAGCLEEETRARLAKQRVADFERNEREISIKAMWVRCELYALLAEGVVLMWIAIVHIRT